MKEAKVGGSVGGGRTRVSVKLGLEEDRILVWGGEGGFRGGKEGGEATYRYTGLRPSRGGFLAIAVAIIVD